MMRTLVLLLLGAVLSVAAGEEPQGEPLSYTFTIRTKQASVSVHRGNPDFRLRVEVRDSGIAPQVIELDANEISIIDDASVIRFESFDYNGDGFRDFSIRDSTSAPPNEIRHYFFWDPGKAVFAMRDDVRESGVGSFDAKTQTFRDYWRMGPSAESWSEWKFVGQEFRCLKTVRIGPGKAFRDIVPNADDEESYRITTVFRRDGSVRTFYKRER